MNNIWRLSLVIILIIIASFSLYFYYTAPTQSKQVADTIYVQKKATSSGPINNKLSAEEGLTQLNDNLQKVDTFGSSSFIEEITQDLSAY